MVRLMGREIRQ